MVAREITTMVERGPNEGREDVTLVTRLVTMQESALIEGTLPRMMTTTREGMAGTTGSKEKGRLPLIIVEIGNLSRGQEIPGTMSLMLLIIREMILFLYVPSLLHLHPSPWMYGYLIVLLQGTSLVIKKPFLIWLRRILIRKLSLEIMPPIP